MIDNTFGKYLKELRLSRSPQMTQEMLAKAVERSKMTISQFENGKNSPPKGELLNKIVDSLSLTDNEKSKLLFLAAQSRGSLPSDIEEYFFDNPAICDAIRAGMNNSKDVDWGKVASFIGDNHE